MGESVTKLDEVSRIVLDIKIRQQAEAVCILLDNLDWIPGYELAGANVEILAKALTAAREVVKLSKRKNK